MSDETEESAEVQKTLDAVTDAAVAGKVVSGSEVAKDGLNAKTEKVEEDEDISALREWFELIIRAGFWALILYLFVFQVSVVDGPSMQPNFMTNDKLVIDKITYRLSQIRRFDVVVFQTMDMDPPKADREYKDYIKRVIGLPGEKVEIRNAKIFVNGKQLNEPFSALEFSHFYHADDEFTVPPHHYFVMGDNRGNSKDSRSMGLGFVPEKQIRGLVRLRFYPFSRFHWFSRSE